MDLSISWCDVIIWGHIIIIIVNPQAVFVSQQGHLQRRRFGLSHPLASGKIQGFQPFHTKHSSNVSSQWIGSLWHHVDCLGVVCCCSYRTFADMNLPFAVSIIQRS